VLARLVAAVVRPSQIPLPLYLRGDEDVLVAVDQEEPGGEHHRVAGPGYQADAVLRR